RGRRGSRGRLLEGRHRGDLEAHGLGVLRGIRAERREPEEDGRGPRGGGLHEGRVTPRVSRIRRRGPAERLGPFVVAVDQAVAANASRSTPSTSCSSASLIFSDGRKRMTWL